MVQSIDTALVIEFSAMVHELAQQKISKLRPYTILKQMQGDVFAYDGLGRVEAREVTGRNVPATFDDITHTRRKIARRRFMVNLPIDQSDVRGALMNPDSEYASACVAAMQRQYDRVVYQAAFADVYTGRDFETTVTAATDGVITVDATAGLTYEKVLEILQNFADVDVDEGEKKFMTITGDEHTSLMGEVELTSNDYSRMFDMEGGKIKSALGLDLIMFGASVPSPIIPVVSSQRQLLAATSRGICVGISKEMSVKIQERTDLVETDQVQILLEMGAVRTEGVLVQKVTVTA